MANLFEKTLTQETLYKGQLLHFEKLSVALPDGNTSTREIVRHPGAVALLALLHNKVVLVRQYRKAVERAIWEVPAGLLEPNEAPIDCAQRELMEETHYQASSLKELNCFFPAPGFCDESLTLFLAKGLSAVEGVERDDDEFLEVGVFSQAQAQALIESGDVCDAKTLLALALWQLGV